MTLDVAIWKQLTTSQIMSLPCGYALDIALLSVGDCDDVL